MKKKYLLFVLFAISNVAVWGQVSIKIDRIILDNVIEAKDTDLYISHWGGGPSVTMCVSITNTSHDEIKICRHEDYELYCTYEYEGTTHKTVDIYLSIDENHPLVILPDSTYNESFSTNLYLPFNVMEQSDIVIYDHSLVLNEVMSSFKMILHFGGRKYVSNSNPVITKGDSFYNEHKWEVN